MHDIWIVKRINTFKGVFDVWAFTDEQKGFDFLDEQSKIIGYDADEYCNPICIVVN